MPDIDLHRYVCYGITCSLTGRSTRWDSIKENVLGTSINPRPFARARLAEFDAKWGGDYPSIVQSWRRNWPRVVPFFDYPAEIRKVIYTTNAIEDVATSRYVSVNMSQRLVTKNRGSLPNDDATIGAVLSGTAQHQQEMDDADSELEGGAKSVHHHVR